MYLISNFKQIDAVYPDSKSVAQALTGHEASMTEREI